MATDYDLYSIQTLKPEDEISDSVETFNYNYNTLYFKAVEIQTIYNRLLYPLIEYYKENSELIYNSLSLYSQNSANWDDFLSITHSNSSKWLQPVTIFYPTLFEDSLTEENIESVNNWLKKYFPIKNSDGTLNYIENQKFVVSCYIYSYGNNNNILDLPYSYSNCKTTGSKITLHCKTIITGGWVYCHQGSYNCDRTINCYPSLQVDCWYESPYLHITGTPILTSDPISAKQDVISKISAEIEMDYQERKEIEIKNILFIVNECDWLYRGLDNIYFSPPAEIIYNNTPDDSNEPPPPPALKFKKTIINATATWNVESMISWLNSVQTYLNLTTSGNRHYSEEKIEQWNPDTQQYDIVVSYTGASVTNYQYWKLISGYIGLDYLLQLDPEPYITLPVPPGPLTCTSTMNNGIWEGTLTTDFGTPTTETITVPCFVNDNLNVPGAPNYLDLTPTVTYYN
jgi:hypothetical protein